jgi:hypothetical protein
MVGKLFVLGEAETIVLSHTAAVVKDTPIYIAGIGVLLPQSSADAGVAVAYKTEGLVNATVASGVAVAIGNLVFYDTATDRVVITRPAAGFYLGVAVSAGTGDAGGTVGVDVIINKASVDPLDVKAVTALSDAAATLTAAQVLGGIVTQTPSAGRAVTLPAASALLALIPGAVVGSAIELTVKNLAAATHAITVTASASITNGGIAGDFTVAATASATYMIVFTNVTAGSVAAVAYRK